MAKLVLVLVAVTLFLVTANATLHATVEVDEVEENRPGMQKCKQEFMSQQRLMGCRMFMRRQMSRGTWSYMDDEEDDEMENQRHYMMNKCCNELRGIDRMCVCPNLKMALEMIQQRKGEFSGPQMMHMCNIASNLPVMCRVSPTRCAFGQGRWAY